MWIHTYAYISITEDALTRFQPRKLPWVLLISSKSLGFSKSRSAMEVLEVIKGQVGNLLWITSRINAIPDQWGMTWISENHGLNSPYPDEKHEQIMVCSHLPMKLRFSRSAAYWAIPSHGEWLTLTHWLKDSKWLVVWKHGLIGGTAMCCIRIGVNTFHLVEHHAWRNESSTQNQLIKLKNLLLDYDSTTWSMLWRISFMALRLCLTPITSASCTGKAPAWRDSISFINSFWYIPLPCTYTEYRERFSGHTQFWALTFGSDSLCHHIPSISPDAFLWRWADHPSFQSRNASPPVPTPLGHSGLAGRRQHPNRPANPETCSVDTPDSHKMTFQQLFFSAYLSFHAFIQVCLKKPFRPLVRIDQNLEVLVLNLPLCGSQHRSSCRNPWGCNWPQGSKFDLGRSLPQGAGGSNWSC